MASGATAHDGLTRNGWDEPCKSRGLRTVLWAAGGEIPPADPAFAYPKGSIFDALGKDNYRLYQDHLGDPLGRIPQVASIKGISFCDVDDLSHFEADLAAGYTARYTFIEPSYGDVVK